MSESQISWHVTLAIRPDRFDQFVALTREMVAAAQTESGVLIYERYINDEKTFVHVYERYADSAAALDHLRSFAKTFGGRFSSLVERKQFVVCGSPTGELRALIDEYDVEYASRLDGFNASVDR